MLIAPVIGAGLVQSAPCFAADIDLPRLPAASPDGKWVSFTWRGDLWKAPAEGGVATRLTSHAADESRSAWSPDGSMIAFDSTRDGGRNLYTIDPAGGNLRRVTSTDEALVLSSFGTTPTGEVSLEFSGTPEYDLFRATRPYYVPLTGGEPVRRHEAFGSSVMPSPDGKQFLFERGGSDWARRGYRGSDNRDVWLYTPDASGDARFTQVTDHDGNDGWACWRDNDSFLFLSDRDLGTVNVFVQEAKPFAAPRRLTGFEGTDVVDLTVSADGRRAYFTAWDSLYRLDLDSAGAQPVRLALKAPDDTLDADEVRALGSAATEFALNPDGKSGALVAFGDLWVKAIEGKSPARRLTDHIARENEIAWSPDGETLYFTSDVDGGESIMTATVAATREDIEASAKALDPKPPEPAVTPAPPVAAEPLAVAPEPVIAPEPAAVAPEPPTDPAPAAVSPEPAPAPPAAAPSDPAAALAPTAEKPKEEKPKEKAKDKDKDKPKSERWAQAMRFEVKPLIEGDTCDRSPQPSPDGKWLAFRRGRGDLMMMDLESKAIRLVATGWDPDLEMRWSPDSKWLAYTTSDRDFNADIFVVPADGSASAINITRHPDNDGSPRWSADSRMLGFLSERTNEEVDVWCVFLDKSLEWYPRFELEKYFKDAGDAAKKRKPLEKPAAIAADAAKDAAGKEPAATPDAKAEDAPKPAPVLSFADAYRRVRRVTSMPGNEGNLEIAPAGDKFYFTGGDATDGGLQSIGWDGTGQKKLGSRADVRGITLTGDKLVTVQGGKGQLVPAEGGSGTAVDVDVSISVERAELVQQKFAEAVRLMGENFYHPTMKGLDWDALGARYGELATHARTGAEFDHVANRLLGELNASHLGIRSPASGGRTVLPQGRLGARVSSTPTGLRVEELVPESPALLSKVPLKVGDLITAIEFEPIRASDTLASRMAGTINRELVFSIDRPSPDGTVISFQTMIAPVNDAVISRLAYRATQERNAALVDEWSQGRIGYAHIQGMGQDSLDEFERDLFAACEGKDGLLIDVRNNGGGWTADRLLASLCAPVHAYTVPRGADPAHTDGYPQDRLFIQRFAGPVNMLCNQKSFSNAEIIAHAFKTLHRGTLVGMPTYGGVISTGSASLLDGTSVRMPTRGWYLPDGTDLELHGAIPDVIVEQTPMDEATSNDRQLRAAVDNLVARLPAPAVREPAR